MRANHATRGPEPARRTVGGRWCAARRWLPRPRAVAAGGALLAQLWGFGAPVSCAAGAERPPEPAGRALAGGPAAPVRPAEQPGTAPAGPAGGLLDGLASAVPGGATDVLVLDPAAATGSIGGALQELIRAGGLPLPGQRAAVPDAFAIASGLLDAATAQARPAEAHAPPGVTADGPSGPAARPCDAGLPVRPGDAPHGLAAPPPAAPGRSPHAAAGHPVPADGGGGRTAARERGPASAGAPGPGTTAPPAGATARTAAVTVAHDTAGTATSVLAPITAGLLLTGAAMYKHRGLPKGH
ncbi:hypothetical protein ABTX81_37525 [Kitasatospora sp. NPDC097605]|uniref:hypothetical protein n=1 Tax=Kitasatospora sp. NPDC097605 TaxID=3157226 RepID=UPI00331D685C